MELKDLKFLAAANLLGGSISEYSSNGGRTHSVNTPSKSEIEAAVRTSQQIWEEVLKQDRE